MGLRGRSNFKAVNFYFVTTTVVKHTKVFTKDKYCDILIENIKFYRQKYHFNIYGYVIMPTHFHWIVKTNKKFGTISDIMRDLKKYCAWELMDELEKGGRSDLINIFSKEANKTKKQKRQFWKHRFDDKVIRNVNMFRDKLKYMHFNPVKAKIVEKPEEYKYSSARNYLNEDHRIIFIKTEWF